MAALRIGFKDNFSSVADESTKFDAEIAEFGRPSGALGIFLAQTLAGTPSNGEAICWYAKPLLLATELTVKASKTIENHRLNQLNGE